MPGELKEEMRREKGFQKFSCFLDNATFGYTQVYMISRRALRCFVSSYLAAAFFLNSSLGADTFRFRIPADPQTLDWTRASSSYETYALMNIMVGLVELDKNLQPQPALAKNWEVSNDGLTYVFNLRPGVKWSDGVPLQAKDFVFSWKRLLDPSSKNDYTSFLTCILNAAPYHDGKIQDFKRVGVKALDSDRLEVKLDRVVPHFLSLLSFWVTFPQREDLVKKKNWDSAPSLVVLGPYRITRWQHGKEIDFERNPSFYGNRPSVEHVKAIIEADDAQARDLLANNQIDALLAVRTEDIEAFQAIPSERKKSLKQFEYLATVFLTFNTESPPLHKKLLRQALAFALDRGAIPTFMKGGQIPASSLVPKGIAGFDPSTSIVTSLEKAREYIKSAGYKSPAEIPKLTLLSTQGKLAEAATYVKSVLESSLGLKIDLNLLSVEDFAKARKRGKYDIMISSWGADYPDAISFLEPFLSRSSTNSSRWKNPHYDLIVKKAMNTLSMIERTKAYSDAQRILLQDEVAIFPLYYPKNTALLGPTVREFEITPLNYLFFNRVQMN